MINVKRSGIFTLFIMLLMLSGCKGEKEPMLFQAENYCLFSAMEGTLTFEGKPAAGAKVVRQIEVNKKEKPDVVIADEAGHFSFGTINRKIRQSFLTEFVVRQEIFVHYQGQEYKIWHMSKGGGPEYEEFGGSKLVNVRCELMDELSYDVEIENGLLVTSCLWDGINNGASK